MRIEIIVTPDGGPEATTGRLRWPGGDVACVLGRGGVRTDKREGDGATPVGRFVLRRVLWRADRLPPPETGLPLGAIAEDDGWCDSPEDPAYNRPVTRPYPASHEAMWRDDHLYDVVIDIADDGRGSAGAPHGNGLRGIAERLAQFGGDLLAGDRQPAGFALRLRLPAPGAGR